MLNHTVPSAMAWVVAALNAALWFSLPCAEMERRGRRRRRRTEFPYTPLSLGVQAPARVGQGLRPLHWLPSSPSSTVSPHLAPNAPVQRHRDSFSSILLGLWQEAAVKAVCLSWLICYSYTPRGSELCFHCLRDGICLCYALEKQPAVVQGAGGEARGLGSQKIFVVELVAAADTASRYPAASQSPLLCGMP